MENFINCLLPFIEVALWIIIIVAIVKYNPEKEEMFLMKDERGEEVVIFTVKMDFDRHHNHIHHLDFRCGAEDEDKARQGCLSECENLAYKLGVHAVMRITLINEDTGEREVLHRIRKTSDSSELVEPDDWRIYNAIL